jgi:hypothetical protein
MFRIAVVFATVTLLKWKWYKKIDQQSRTVFGRGFLVKIPTHQIKLSNDKTTNKIVFNKSIFIFEIKEIVFVFHLRRLFTID